jgi:hypothetical protein
LIPNLPENSVTVLDNASYQSRQINKLPTKSSRKGEIQEFMEANNLTIPIGKVTKADLIKIMADENNNRAEQLMNIVARFNMGKRLRADCTNVT